MTGAMLGLLLPGGCALQEIRGKTSFGPEYRNRGDSTSEVRYDGRQAVEFRWDKGMTTGLTYRRRDVDNGSGDAENLFLFEVGYPLWKAPAKPDKADARIAELEQRISELETQQSKGVN
jgi:hypothetical protein